MQIKWLVRAHTDPLAVNNMRLPVHDTKIRRRHRSQHTHQWHRTVNSSITINSISQRRRCCRNTIDTASTIEMETVALRQSQPHRCQPDRRCTTINNSSTSKLASTSTMRCRKRMSNMAVVAASNVYDIDRIIAGHYFDAFSIICGTRGPASSFHHQPVNFYSVIQFEREIERES